MRRMVSVFTGFVLFLVVAVAAQAQGEPPGGGVTVWNEDYTLATGKVLEGDLLVFNGNATLEADSRVQGSVVVFNGNAEVDGVIEQDLVVTNGRISLNENAWVRGDVVCSFNCKLEQDPEARVDGQVITGLFRFPGMRLPGLDVMPEMPAPVLPRVWTFEIAPHRLLGAVFRIGQAFLTVIVVTLIAGLLALLWPNQVVQVEKAVLEAPLVSLGVGVLAALVAAIVMVALILTICLPPLIFLALVAAGLFGWVSIGTLVGERLLRALNVRSIVPVWAAALGTLVLSIVTAGLSAIPCVNVIGWLLIIMVGCLGLGAVVLTRWGTHVYRVQKPVVECESSGPSEDSA